MMEYKTDILVVGGGAAGSRAAYEAKKYNNDLDVLLVDAGKYGSTGSSNLVASESLGINAPFNYTGDGDDSATYLEDMINTGRGLGDPGLCRIIAEESCARLSELINMGLEFDTEDGHPVQRKLSGCTKARSLTCGGATGREIVRVLKDACKKSGVNVLEEVRILELIQDKNNQISGAIGAKDGKMVVINSGAVIIATGGAGRIFRENINPPYLKGDGWAMAYRAGARLVNLEFFQIGPVVKWPSLKFIIHSHMWRLNPEITNSEGKEFVKDYCPAGINPAEVIDAKAMSYPFSVRTIAKYLDIAIFKEILSGRGSENKGVFFDVTHIEKDTFKEKAPITYNTLNKAGADLASDKIEIGLGVQNFNGGILIDEDGFTGVEGLYAAGEASGGVHGADRPGGNNLTDTQVFGYRAGRAAARYAQEFRDKKNKQSDHVSMIKSDSVKNEEEILRQSADLFFRNLTIVREREGLEKVLNFTEKYNKSQSFTLRNRLLTGKLLALAALARKESRGTHYREDFPEKDEEWEKKIIISRGAGDEPEINIE